MIWVRKTKNDFGGYVDKNGDRFTVEWCVGMVTPDGTGPANHGYEQHESIAAACETWQLSVYIDPEAITENGL